MLVKATSGACKPRTERRRCDFISLPPGGYASRCAPKVGWGECVSDIFREIDEELRRDNLLKLWARYGRYIVAVVAVALVVAGGIAAWRAHQLSERQAQSARFSSALALARAGKEADAATVFATIAKEGGVFAILASFENAALLAKAGERKKAAAAFDQIAQAGGVSPAFRELAVLLSVMHDTLDADPKAAIARLAPLTAPGGAWRPTALELTAAAQLKLGDKKAALTIYQGLAHDLAAPRGLRGRAAEMAAALAP